MFRLVDFSTEIKSMKWAGIEFFPIQKKIIIRNENPFTLLCKELIP